MANLKPRFQVEVLKDHTVNQTIYKRVPIEGVPGKFTTEIEKVTRVVPESFMVYFPAGHSVWYETQDDMRRAGLLNPNELVDMETGLPAEPPAKVDYKAEVERKTKRGPNSLRTL